ARRMAPISFARGAPAPSCLDPALISDCARAALERDGTTILSYGTGGGYGPLRELLAERHGVDPGRVFVTTGALKGFVFYSAAQLARRPGRVLVEAPTYDRPLKLLRWQGVNIVGVPMDDEGLEPAAREEEIARGGAAARRTRVRARSWRRRVVPLHHPDVPEPEREDARRGAAAADRRAVEGVRLARPGGRSRRASSALSAP